MASCTFTAYSISGTNTDKKRGQTVTGSFSLSSGSLPSGGGSLQSVSVSISNIVVYSSVNPGFSTLYGNFDLAESDGGSQNNQMHGASSAILNFTGGNITFTVLGGSSSTSNVLNVRSGSIISITITYSESNPSTGTLSTTAVRQGGSIALNVNPASSTFTHSVRWYRDSSHQQTVELDSESSSATLNVPSNWPVGTAYAYLYSYSNGGYVGSNTYSFTITVDPSSIQPTAGTLSVSLLQSVYIPSSWNLYVKGYSRVRLSLSGCTPGSGASYKSIALACGSQLQNTASTTVFETSEIAETGNVSCQAAVTNSYNNTASAQAKTITVYDYFDPVFNLITAFRCNANGVPSDNGAYFGVTASVSIASVNGRNRLLTLQARYAVQGSSAWSTATNITNGQQTIIGGNASGTATYQVQVIAIDDVQNLRNTNSNRTVVALTSQHVIYCMDGGLNVSFGMEGTRTNAVQINPDWGLYHGDTRLDGTVTINRGGTGATTVAGARNNLGLGNTNGAVPVANGGTGASNAESARNNLGITPANIGAAPSSHNHSAGSINSGTLNEARLPFKVRYGSVYVNGVSWSSVSFSGFSSTPAILCTVGGGASAINGSYSLSVKTKDESSSGFSVCICGSSGSGQRLINWVAIGT